MTENIGVLLHKLTKYQTLLSNTHSHQKIDIYNQKINSYSQKLNKIGVNQSNINQLGGLVGGIDAATRNEELKQKFKSISLKRPEIDINNGVQRLGNEATASIAKLKEEIKENKERIVELERLNKEKEAIIENITKDKEALQSNYDELSDDYERAMGDFLEYQRDVEQSTGAAQNSNNKELEELERKLKEATADGDLGEQSKQISASLIGEAPVVEEPAAIEAPAAIEEQDANKAQPVELQQSQPEEPPLET